MGHLALPGDAAVADSGETAHYKVAALLRFQHHKPLIMTPSSEQIGLWRAVGEREVELNSWFLSHSLSSFKKNGS